MVNSKGRWCLCFRFRGSSGAFPCFLNSCWIFLTRKVTWWALTVFIRQQECGTPHFSTLGFSCEQLKYMLSCQSLYPLSLLLTPQHWNWKRKLFKLFNKITVNVSILLSTLTGSCVNFLYLLKINIDTKYDWIKRKFSKMCKSFLVFNNMRYWYFFFFLFFCRASSPLFW